MKCVLVWVMWPTEVIELIFLLYEFECLINLSIDSVLPAVIGLLSDKTTINLF